MLNYLAEIWIPMRLLLLLIPWLELWSLIELGSEIGAFNTILYVFATFMFGLWLIRRQGEGMLAKLREQVRGPIGPQMLVDNLAMAACGLLLMVPGLMTDVLALMLMFGPLRRRVFSKRTPQTGSGHTYQHEETDSSQDESKTRTTLEGDYRRLDDE